MRKLMLSCGSAALLFGTHAFGQGVPAPAPRPAQPAQRPATANPAQAPAATPTPDPRTTAAQIAEGDIKVLPGPIDGPKDLLATARLAFMMVDTNRDQQISQQEATEAGNMLVGGVFFRADTNGDGVLSQDELQQAKQRIYEQEPMLRFLLARVERRNTPQGEQPAGPLGEVKPSEVTQDIGKLLDVNNDQQIQASEVRQAVQTIVQTSFSLVDRDGNGQISPQEINEGAIAIVQEGAQAAFKGADADNNGTLTKEEFAQALIQPGYVFFDILDRNLDGQLSPEELNQALQIAYQQALQAGFTPPANSPETLLNMRD